MKGELTMKTKTGTSAVSALTGNQYYGGLNRRFERRATLLRRLGFKYQHIDGLPMACFVRPEPCRRIPRCIPASTLHHADNRAWIDTLRGALGR